MLQLFWLFVPPGAKRYFLGDLEELSFQLAFTLFRGVFPLPFFWIPPLP